MRPSARVWFLALLVGAGLAAVPITVGGQEPAVPEAWKSLDAQGLADLAKQLDARGDAGASDRGLLVAYVAWKHLGTATAARAVSPVIWRQWARCLKKEMATETRRAWATQLRDAFAAADRLGSLAAPDAVPLSWTLKELGDDQIPAFFAMWMAAGPAWKAIGKPADWGWLTQNLAHGSDAAKPVRAQLAQHVTATFLATPEAVRSIGPWAWSEFARTLSDFVTPDARTAWATTLREVYTEPAALAALNPPEQLSLAWAFRYLQSGKDSQNVLVAWMTGSADWKAMRPDDLAWLGQNLLAAGDKAEGLRGQLAAHVTQKHLATAEEAKKVGPWAWSELARTAGAGLPEDARREWAARLKAAYGEPAILAALKPDEQVCVARAFDHLKQGEDCRMALMAYVGGSDAWTSMDAAGLLWVAENLAHAGDAAKGAREQVAAHVMGKYLTSAQAARAVTVGQWSGFARTLAWQVPAEARQAWAARLKEAYGAPEAMAALKIEEQLDLARAFSYLGSAECGPVLVAWMGRGDGWRSMDAGGLMWLAQKLRAVGAASKSQRDVLAVHVVQTHLGSVEAGRKVTCEQWSEFALSLAGSVDAEARKVWAARLREAYGAPESLAALKAEEQLSLAWAFRYLGSGGDSRTVLVAWMTGGEAWKAAKPDMLAWLAQNLGSAGGSAKPLREQLVAHVGPTYLGTVEDARKVGCWAWSALARSLQGELDFQARQAWAEKIRAAYASAETVGALAVEDVLWVGEALEHLNSRPAYDLLVPYMQKADWRGWKPEILAAITDRLNDLGALAAKERRAVGEHALTTLAVTPEAVRAVPLEAWIPLARCGEGLPEDARRRWADALQGAFAPDAAALLAKTAPEVARLTEAITPLDRGRAVRLAFDWMKGSEQVAATSMKDLWAVAKMAVDRKGLPADEKYTVPTVFESALAKMPDQADTYDYYLWLMCQWNHVGNYAKVQEWATKAYQKFLGSEEARAKVPMGVLDNLGMWFYHTWMTKPGQGYAGFAAALARHARAGTLKTSRPEELAALLGTPETRDVLKAELVDAVGHPRPAVAEILAWAHRQAGDLGAWCAFVDQHVEAASSGDVKAMWTIVKAYTEVLEADPPEPVRRLHGLKEALASARSEAVRLVALEALVEFYRQRGGQREAMDLLESVKGQFGADAVGQIVRLQDSLGSQAVEAEAHEGERRAAARRSMLQAELAYRQRCLAQAREEENREAVAALEQGIAQLEQELNP